MKKKVTIHDIARALKIDSSTVSRALSKSSRVKPKTRAAVEKMAKELGYQPNILASNLRKNKSNTIGVIVPYVSRYFFSSVIAGIDEITHEAGYNVIICQSMDKLDREKKLIETLVANRVDGVIMSVSMETINSGHLKPFEAHDIPLILFDRLCNGAKADAVVIDDVKVSFEATAHLIEGGCSRIAHFGGPDNVSIYKDRLQGYKEALLHYGIDYDEELVVHSRLTKQDGILSAKKVLALTDPPDGIFSASDTAAISAMQTIKDQGVKIPEEISFVGFSNEPISSVIEPSLTTIDQPGYEMGKRSATFLLDRLASSKVDNLLAQTITIESKLIKRGSSMRPEKSENSEIK